jgi:hypothetical protein
MAVITPPVGLVQLSAPLPQPRQYTLLDAARETPQPNERWLGGITSEGYVPGPDSLFDPCSTGTDRVKPDANAIRVTPFGVFTVLLVGACTSVSIGPEPTDWTARLRLAFEAYEAEAVEDMLVSGGGFTTMGPYITDANMEDLTPGTGPVAPVEGLALLEEEIATVGGGGIIHVTPLLATYLIDRGLISAARAQMQTGLGTRVAVGAGYAASAATTNAGETWAYATGPVEYIREASPIVLPADYSQALDRNNNDVMFIAERSYVLNWVGRTDPADDTHVQAGILIDRTLCGCNEGATV